MTPDRGRLNSIKVTPTSWVRRQMEWFSRSVHYVRIGGDGGGVLAHLMAAYADTPMSLADACLERLSELYRTCRVVTLDRDFIHYRRFGRSTIPLVGPW